MILSQESVKKFGSRPSNRCQKPHEGEDERGHVCTNWQTISNADWLRDDFAEDDYWASVFWPYAFYRAHSPIRTVLPRTAGQPPPSDRSSTIGRVSLTMTLLRSSVTRTQCFPLCKSLNTRCACRCSLPSPDVAMTWRYTPSCPINLIRVSVSRFDFRAPETILTQLSILQMPHQATPAQLQLRDTATSSHLEPLQARPSSTGCVRDGLMARRQRMEFGRDQEKAPSRALWWRVVTRCSHCNSSDRSIPKLSTSSPQSGIPQSPLSQQQLVGPNPLLLVDWVWCWWAGRRGWRMFPELQLEQHEGQTKSGRSGWV